MDTKKSDLDREETTIKDLAEDIKPAQDGLPDSLAEATTVPLQGDELGKNAAGAGNPNAQTKENDL